jgi:integrase/recombinase XerD
MLLHVIRLMKFDCLRTVEMADIELGCQLWCRDIEFHLTRRVGTSSWESFHYVAFKWLRFHNMITTPVTSSGPVELIKNDFIRFMKDVQGMSPESIRVYASRVEYFLKWAQPHHETLSSISLHNVDDFLEMKRRAGSLPRTIGSLCTALRLFFRYAELRGLNQCGIARGIRNPRIARYDPLPKGLPWQQIRRLLNGEVLPTTADSRAAAILFLCSIYGLRSSEVVNLKLNDFDWINETFVVRRSKRGRVQQYPIQFEVGNAILRYLQFGRPRTVCRNLFLTLKPPYRPVRPSTLWAIISNRVQRLGLDFKIVGPHSFRHACATELLRQGSSLQEIADFLGHRDLDSVSIYAKHDMRSLRKVADFSLAGVR